MWARGGAVIREPAPHRHIRLYCHYNAPATVTATAIDEPSKPHRVNTLGFSEVRRSINHLMNTVRKLDKN